MVKQAPLVLTFTGSATTTSGWQTLDYKYQGGEAVDRGFFVTLASSTNYSVALQVAASAPDSSGAVDTFYTVSTWTESTEGVLTGNWPAIRVVYVGGGDAGTSTFVLTR